MMQQWVTRIGSVLLIGLGFCLAQQPTAAQSTNADAELVYLDANGYIRVLDPTTATNSATVQWVSPVGGWVDIALGDFNGDGDSEIAAIKGTTGSGQLTIYDPVIASGTVVPNQLINGIPWRILFDGPLAGRPYVMAAGDLDPNVAGSEIIYSALLNAEDEDENNDEVALVVLHATAAGGSAWTPLTQRTTSVSPWQQITVGNLDGVAPDEVIVVDKLGSLEVYQLNTATFTRIFNAESKARPWQTTTIARFFSTGLPGLATARATSPGAASFLVFVYEPNEDGPFRDAHNEFFLPAPDRLFGGDVNGNGDEEIFFLRSVPSNLGLPRLVMRNRGGDTPPAFEEVLDTDNGYQSGIAADVDGDSRAEVIVMRNNKVRIYTQPEINKTVSDLTPAATTNSRTLLAGNLDRNGYLRTPSFGVTPTKLEGDLAAGEQSAQGTFSLTNRGAGGSLPFTVRSQGQPDWLWLGGVTGQTPGAFTAAFDARLLMAGTYTTTILVESSNTQVNNAPLSIGVKLTVRPGLVPRSLGIITTPITCGDGAEPFVVDLPIDGPTGMTFVARILEATEAERSDTQDGVNPSIPSGLEWPSAVTWVTAQSTNSTPTTLQLTFQPTQVTGTFVNATLELTAADNQGAQVRSVPLGLLCTQAQLYLPLIAR